MKFKTKSIIKKVALVLAGVTAITAAGFGVKALVDYTQDDLKPISPTFEVGNLGSDGKFVADESTLYTKEAFGCYGLQIKPDFDSTVNYRIYYYDILDNFVSSSNVLADGFSAEAPVNGAYARLVIEPREDEDGKISLIERVKYPGELTIKVKKEQDIENRFVAFKGKIMDVVSETESLVFTNNCYLNWETLEWENIDIYSVTSTTVLKVNGGSTLKCDFSKLSRTNAYCRVFEFKDFPFEDNKISSSLIDGGDNSLVLNEQTRYVIIMIDQHDPAVPWTDPDVLKFPSCFSITKK